MSGVYATAGRAGCAAYLPPPGLPATRPGSGLDGCRRRRAHRRQPHREAGAEHLGRPAAGRLRHPVLDPNATGMRLDDLPGDRESEPGILAKTLVRPVGIETLEDLVQG